MPGVIGYQPMEKCSKGALRLYYATFKVIYVKMELISEFYMNLKQRYSNFEQTVTSCSKFFISRYNAPSLPEKDSASNFDPGTPEKTYVITDFIFRTLQYLAF